MAGQTPTTLFQEWFGLIRNIDRGRWGNMETLTRAPLGYFYNAPHWGVFRAPSDLRNYWIDSKNSSGF